MSTLERRVEDLERRIPQLEDEGAEIFHAVMNDILDELANLKSCRSTKSSFQPTDPTGDHFGYPYTRGDLVGFAIRRVFERKRDEAPDILSEETTEEMIASWTEGFRTHATFGESWDEVEMEEPPGPATISHL